MVDTDEEMIFKFTYVEIPIPAECLGVSDEQMEKYTAFFDELVEWAESKFGPQYRTCYTSSGYTYKDTKWACLGMCMSNAVFKFRYKEQAELMKLRYG